MDVGTWIVLGLIAAVMAFLSIAAAILILSLVWNWWKDGLLQLPMPPAFRLYDPDNKPRSPTELQQQGEEVLDAEVVEAEDTLQSEINDLLGRVAAPAPPLPPQRGPNIWGSTPMRPAPAAPYRGSRQLEEAMRRVQDGESVIIRNGPNGSEIVSAGNLGLLQGNGFAMLQIQNVGAWEGRVVLPESSSLALQRMQANDTYGRVNRGRVEVALPPETVKL